MRIAIVRKGSCSGVMRSVPAERIAADKYAHFCCCARLGSGAIHVAEAREGFVLNNSRCDRVSHLNSILEMKIKLPVIVLAALLFAGLPLASSNAYVAVSVAIAPPAIPVYVQPYCPAPGYLWTPGYWAWDGYDYYWVPGVWVAPPRVGFL